MKQPFDLIDKKLIFKAAKESNKPIWWEPALMEKISQVGGAKSQSTQPHGEDVLDAKNTSMKTDNSIIGWPTEKSLMTEILLLLLIIFLSALGSALLIVIMPKVWLQP